MSFEKTALAAEINRSVRRALVVDGNVAGARLLADLVKSMGVRELHIESGGRAALRACQQHDPQVIFTEFAGPRLNGIEFVRGLRRSDLSCRKAPVIMVTAEATASAIKAARDCGVHEFLRRPFTLGDLTRRLEAVLLHPRPWVEAVGYVGPDRRRFNSGDYQGPRKRQRDTQAASDADQIAEAVKILKSAIPAIETDPAQAMRAMQTQAATLKEIGRASANLGLMTAVASLQRALQAALDTGSFRPAPIETACAGLWAIAAGETPAEPANMLEL
jgi:CheY-like chemotaxis protein